MGTPAVRGGVTGSALAACLALGACTGGDGMPSGDDVLPTEDPAGVVPENEADAVPAAPNFEFVIGEAYRSDPSVSAESLTRIEAFFGETVIGPLQRLPGLLPRTVTVTYDRCGEANAYHDAATATITLCHELSQYAYALYAAAEGAPSQDVVEMNRRAFFGMAFVLHRLVARALDVQLDLPLGGNRESAIDAIATVVSVESGGFGFLYALGGAALINQLPPPLAGERGAELDRAGDIGCWVVGGSQLARTSLLDPGLALLLNFEGVGRDCASEYARQRDVVRGWVPGLSRLNVTEPEPDANVSASFRLRLGQDWLERAGADPGARSRVTRLLERAFVRLDNAIGTPVAPIDVVYDTCGEARSSWDAPSRTVTLCHELVELAYPAILAPFEPAPNANESAYAAQLAYSLLEFHLHHEIGHALGTSGLLPGIDPLEVEADAVAAVLLSEAGEGFLLANALLHAVGGPSPEQADRHGGPSARSTPLLCLILGGNASLRWDPYFGTQELLERFVTGERDCVAEYAARRDEVRGWLAGLGDGAPRYIGSIGGRP